MRSITGCYISAKLYVYDPEPSILAVLSHGHTYTLYVYVEVASWNDYRLERSVPVWMRLISSRSEAFCRS